MKPLLMARKLTIFLNRFPGGKRVAERVRTACSRFHCRVQIEDFDGNLQFACDLDEHMCSHIFWRGYYSTEQLQLLDRLLTPEMVFVDVGANHGEFTLFAAKRCGKGKVFAFEPMKDVFARLEENVRRNSFANVALYNQGLSNVDKRLALYTSPSPFADSTVNRGISTVFKTDDRNTYIQDILVQPLDALAAALPLPRLDVMKIDVEGSELAVLQGAKETIARCKPVILVEVSAETCASAGYTCEDLIGYIRQQGYRVESIESGGRTVPLARITSFQNVVCYPQ